jgi:exportin-2 (importin alpha re-exporter)
MPRHATASQRLTSANHTPCAIAENALKQEENKAQYSLTLLNIVASDPLPLKTRLAAALAFKNFIRLNYVDEAGNYKLPVEEVATIKQESTGRGHQPYC